MKKYFLVVVCALLLFVVTGCGNKNQLKCTGSMEDSGLKINAEVVADFDENDKLTDATIVYDLGDSDTAKAWCSIFEYMKDADKGIDVKCSGSKITITGYAKVADDDEESMVGKTKEEFKEAMAAEQITCK